MRKILLLIFGFLGFFTNAQNKLSFNYDAAGNQILRQWCLGCNSKTIEETPKDVEDINLEDLQKFYPEDIISYYPNPVKEQLYIKWETINNNYVVAIEIYNLNGQKIKSYKKLEGTDNYVISFYELPRNVYSLNLIYLNGEQKSIKIIKE